ncbi:DUF4199 family protein [bacterium]|nr:DUF4199 family protein [bacterium]
MHPVVRKWGLYMGLISIALSSIFWATGLFKPSDNNTWVTLISVVVSLVILYVAGTELKKAHEGILPFGMAFKGLFGVLVISMLFSVVWMLLYTTVFEPDYQQTIIDQTYEKMLEQNPNMPEDQVDMAIGLTEKMTSPLVMVLFTVVFGLLFGAIEALIMALVVRREEAFPLR